MSVATPPAPGSGATKSTCPPSTGSPALNGETDTVSGSGKALPRAATWPAPPATARVNPADS